MTRIAYIVADPGIPVFGRKGASVHVQAIVRAARARGHEVHVFAASRGDDVPSDLAELPVSVEPVGSAPAERRERAQRTAAERLADAAVRWGPDVVYERLSLFSTAGARAAAGASARLIVEVNSPLVEEQARHRVLVDEEGALADVAATLAAADTVIAVSAPVAAWAVRRGADPARTRVVPNGVDPARFVPADPAAAPPTGRGEGRRPITVGFVGTLKPWHGTQTLVDALALARNAGADLTLRVVGDGPERRELSRRADAAGVPAVFTGSLAPEDVPKEYALMDIATAPYPAEADDYFSPLKVVEYLAAGVPVVASRVGQIPRLIDGCGVLVPPGDPAALATALSDLAADPERRTALATAGRARAVERHSWDGVLEASLAPSTSPAPAATRVAS
ncbi:glycosyltransferase family 4 protein [Mycetocola reblochoni]|uniref:D-inositol 3-phosphate glycosyltransferase n=2 Tax=Mycetocola reblochoni TaxID=331618 RepID=A0A1R4K9G3_9MICO|nr:glycosyltransferase family 4 protein [Mycetocola reblochoni]RLP68086.1 glycosyltransferase family 1 protein [Mycetocola reblochoni]SJN40653.1 Glycosyltransferase [Mycetocola reblochoni REB411]